MKKLICLTIIVATLMLLFNGNAYAGRRGGHGGGGAELVAGIILGGILFGGNNTDVVYYDDSQYADFQQSIPYCRPWYGQMRCESVVVYNDSPPFYPGYPYQRWYVVPSQPGFVFFIGIDGRHHSHEFHGPITVRPRVPAVQRNSSPMFIPQNRPLPRGPVNRR